MQSGWRVYGTSGGLAAAVREMHRTIERYRTVERSHEAFERSTALGGAMCCAMPRGVEDVRIFPP
jgi:hypothetical protein